MHEVVPSAVRAADRAAITARSTTSFHDVFIRFFYLFTFLHFYISQMPYPSSPPDCLVKVFSATLELTLSLTAMARMVAVAVSVRGAL